MSKTLYYCGVYATTICQGAMSKTWQYQIQENKVHEKNGITMTQIKLILFVQWSCPTSLTPVNELWLVKNNNVVLVLYGFDGKHFREIRARIYQASQSAILVLSAENSWNVLLLSNLSIKAVIKFLKAKNLSYSPQLFKTAGEVSQVVRSCQQGLVMALKRQRRARIFQERRNVFEMFGDEQLIKQVTFPQLFKTSREHLHCQTTS